jgi:hypothetical protein
MTLMNMRVASKTRGEIIGMYIGGETKKEATNAMGAAHKI